MSADDTKRHQRIARAALVADLAEQIALSPMAAELSQPGSEAWVKVCFSVAEDMVTERERRAEEARK